jgi:hypothetical protein
MIRRMKNIFMENLITSPRVFMTFLKMYGCFYYSHPKNSGPVCSNQVQIAELISFMGSLYVNRS